MDIQRSMILHQNRWCCQKYRSCCSSSLRPTGLHMSFQRLFFHVSKSHISKKTEWTHGSAHCGKKCIYSVNFWTCPINILPKQIPGQCFPAYLQFAVKQLNCIIHRLRHDMLFASPDCPWQVDSSYKSFGLPNEIQIDFILIILF